MREIHRTIVSALIFSKDNKLLMGRKDPHGGGVYPDAWHIPGGGVDEGETLQQALIREIKEEVGLDITPYQLTPVQIIGHGDSEKTLKNTGEKVLCHMDFHRFEIHIDSRNADEIPLRLSDDLVETRWFSKTELETVKQIPGGKEFFKQMGYIY